MVNEDYINGVVNELKRCREENKAKEHRISQLNTEIYKKDCIIEDMKEQNKKLLKENAFLAEERKQQDTKHLKLIKSLENKIRKKEIEQIKGTKDKNEKNIYEELVSLRTKYIKQHKFVVKAAELLEFDVEVLENLIDMTTITPEEIICAIQNEEDVVLNSSFVSCNN